LGIRPVEGGSHDHKRSVSAAAGHSGTATPAARSGRPRRSATWSVRAEDIGGQELSYAEVKAIASGNPAVLTLAEADAELQRLNLLKKNHLDEQYVARRSVRDLPSTIESLNERLSKLSADEATATAHAADPIAIGKRSWSREDALAVLAERLDFLPRNVRDTTRVPIGTYKGLSFGLILHPQFPPDVYLEGAITRQSGLSRDHKGPRAVLNALERLAGGYGSECVRVRQDLAIAESQLRDYRERLGKPFPHEKYLSELTDLRDQLKAGLSATAYQAQDDKGPDTAELAARIKALKAANTIEAAPQRVQRKQAAAEEPITTRIRRRQEANTEVSEAVQLGHAPGTEATNDNHHADNDNHPRNGSAKPLTFQERIALERQRQEQGPSLP
jgi:ribonuclease HI